MAINSPPPIFVFERGRSDCDAFASHVLEDVDLVTQGAAGEDLVNLEGFFQGPAGLLGHELLDARAGESWHTGSSQRVAKPTRTLGRRQGAPGAESGAVTPRRPPSASPLPRAA